MNDLDTLTRIRRLTDRLNPAALASLIDEWTRGGHRPNSLNPGRRTTDPALPLPDTIDHDLARQLTNYRRHLDAALKALEAALRIERTVIPPAPGSRHHTRWHADHERAARDLVSPRAVQCANPHCRRVIENTATDRVLSGRCRPCHEYRRAHGTERPRPLIERELERRVL